MTLRVEELMTPIVMTLGEEDTVSRAAEDMQLGGFRHMPVVNAQKHVVGIVSDRDLLRAMVEPQGGKRRLGEVMTHPVIVLRPEAPAHRAAELMLNRKIGALPVVDEHRELVGLITETDLLVIAHNALHGRSGAELLSY